MLAAWQRRVITFTAVSLMAVAGAAAGLFAIGPAAAATPIRIMPLGDSITGGPGCWRALLWDRLQRTGFTDIDFVGTLLGGGCSVAHDGDNEGHGGFLATNIANQNQLPPWLSATRPDIVLMHLGTNDVWNNIPATTILTAFSTLVDQMRSSNPSMRILVAQIIPMTPGGCTWCPPGVAALNAAIPGWAAGKTTAQSPIVVVDQFTGFDTVADTNGDGVHPDDSGFQKMSDRWYPALTPLLVTTPDTTPPTTPTNLRATIACPASVTLNWIASTDNVGVTGYEVFSSVDGVNFTLAGTTTTTTLTQNLRGTQYRVRARDAAGNTSAFTAPVTTLPPPCPPPDAQPPTTPGTPTPTVTCGSVTLTWTPSTDNVGVTGYEIWRAPGASGGTFALVATVTTTSFTASGVGTNRYQIRARDSAGNTSPFTAPVTVTTPACPTGGCTAAYSQVNSWPGGFQGQVTVTNTGTTATTAWTVTLTFANGQRITQIWGARTTSTASPYTINNETYNGALGPNASTTFGFLGSWNGVNNPPTLTCTRTP